MKKTWLLACVAAGLSAGAFHLYLARFENERAGGPLRGVVMVTRDVQVGDTLLEADLALKSVPERFIEERQVASHERELLISARATTALRVGSGVLWTDVDAAPQGRTLASLVRNGMRAVSLRGAEVGFEGLLRPGDRVDVLFTDSTQKERHTRLLLQNALVLTVGEDLGNTPSGSRKASSTRHVSLSVLPADAQRVAHARGRGTLTLTLRNPGDIASLADTIAIGDDALNDPSRNALGVGDAR